MRIKTINVTSTGSEVPVEFTIERIPRATVLGYVDTDKERRNEWCLRGTPCGKYGKRACCPPSVKMFHDLPAKKWLYAVQVKILLDDYYDVYPNVNESKSKIYFGMDGSHKMTRNLQNKISSALSIKHKSQGFRVGGCLGCQYEKSGTCKNFMPALEATGVDVCKLAKYVLGNPIEWRPEKGQGYQDEMIAIGGIYTNDVITKEEFERMIVDVCKR